MTLVDYRNIQLTKIKRRYQRGTRRIILLFLLHLHQFPSLIHPVHGFHLPVPYLNGTSIVTNHPPISSSVCFWWDFSPSTYLMAPFRISASAKIYGKIADITALYCTLFNKNKNYAEDACRSIKRIIRTDIGHHQNGTNGCL